MGDDGLNVIKAEANYFQDEAFQVSFGYIGALFGLVALAALDGVDKLAKDIGTTPAAVLSLAILLLNVTYLTIAWGCIFATLKRGYFIILRSNVGTEGTAEEVLRDWEEFVREPVYQKRVVPGMGLVGWNVDNYFMLPMYVLIVVISLVALFVPLFSSISGVMKIVIGIVFISHVVPGAVMYWTGKMNVRCRDALNR